MKNEKNELRTYSASKPDYWLEYTDDSFTMVDTSLLKLAIAQSEDSGLEDELEDSLLLSEFFFFVKKEDLRHPYCRWLLFFEPYFGWKKRVPLIPDYSFFKSRPYKEFITDELLEERKNGHKLIDRELSDYCTLDVETTGLNHALDSVIQLSAVKYKNGKEVASFDSFIKPSNGRKLPRMITDLTGIRDSDLKDAPSFIQKHDELVLFLEGLPLVGHNLEFDLRMIDSELKRNSDKKRPVYEYVDTLVLAKQKLKLKKGGYSLERIKHRIPNAVYSNSSSHNSLNDCRITGELYEFLKTLN